MATRIRTRRLFARSVTFRTAATTRKAPSRRPSFLAALLRALSSFSM